MILFSVAAACAPAPDETAPDYEVKAGEKKSADRPTAEEEAEFETTPIATDEPEPPGEPAKSSPAPEVDRRPEPAAPCTPDCAVADARRCVASRNAYQTCAEVAPGCLQWQPETTCGTGKECTGAGTCSSTTSKSVGSPCTDDRQCASNRCTSCPYYAGRCCVP